MLSKDHFSNILNEPAGHVAAEILTFVAPRVLYAWQNAGVPLERVMADVESVFHHPALRDEGGMEVHRMIFGAVRAWVDGLGDGAGRLNEVLSSEGVRAGRNLSGVSEHAGHAAQSGGQVEKLDFGGLGLPGAGWGGEGGGGHQGHGAHGQGQGHGHAGGGGFDALGQLSGLPIPGLQGVSQKLGRFSGLFPGGGGFGGGGGGGFGMRGVDQNDGVGSWGIDQNDGGASRGLETESERRIGGNGIDGAGYAEEPPFAPPSGYEIYEGAGAEQVFHAERYTGHGGGGSGSYGGAPY